MEILDSLIIYMNLVLKLYDILILELRAPSNRKPFEGGPASQIGPQRMCLEY